MPEFNPSFKKGTASKRQATSFWEGHGLSIARSASP